MIDTSRPCVGAGVVPDGWVWCWAHCQPHWIRLPCIQIVSGNMLEVILPSISLPLVILWCDLAAKLLIQWKKMMTLNG